MKECIKCHNVFPLTDQFFGRRKDSPDGFRNDCKKCVKKRRDAWHKENREDQLSKMRDYRSKNIEKLLISKREYYKQHKSIIIEKCHEYYHANRDKVLAQMKEHRSKNKEKINQARRKRRKENPEAYLKTLNEYKEKNKDKIRVRSKIYCAEKRKNDVRYRILNNIRSRTSVALKRCIKSDSTMNLTGCSLSSLKKHLAEQFKPGMSWDNYGKWHVDHVIPCASFNLEDPEEQRVCFHYTNLQPLWAKENSRKGAKVEKPFVGMI